jgi:uncharacterized membrane protein YGL010W
VKLPARLLSNYGYYAHHHRTAGCRITHMIGVPLIAASCMLLLVPKRRSLGAGIFVFGWFLQFLGHFAFEHNRPVFLELRDPYTAVSSILFVTKRWMHVVIRHRF